MFLSRSEQVLAGLTALLWLALLALLLRIPRVGCFEIWWRAHMRTMARVKLLPPDGAAVVLRFTLDDEERIIAKEVLTPEGQFVALAPGTQRDYLLKETVYYARDAWSWIPPVAHPESGLF